MPSLGRVARPFALSLALLALAAAAHAAPSPTPADSDLVRIRAACAGARHVKISARHLGNDYDSLAFDSAGVHAWVPQVPERSITSLTATTNREQLVPWSDVRQIQVNNPKARPGLSLLVDIGCVVLAAVLTPASDNQLTDAVVVSAASAAASSFVTMSVTHGYQPDLLRVWPPKR